MNPYQMGGSNGSAEISYLSPKGHYYVAKGELDTRYARQAQTIGHSLLNGRPASLSQFEIAKRTSRG